MYPGSWTSAKCGTCRFLRPLRGRTETRTGCVVALYGWHRRDVPEDVERANIVDLVELVRRGDTTRQWIEVALRMDEHTQACAWWDPRETGNAE